MRAAFALSALLSVLLGVLLVPPARAGLSWGHTRFERQPELCRWLRAHRSRCDVWAIRHPQAWQSLAETTTRHGRAAQPGSSRVSQAIRTGGPTQAVLALLASAALILSLAPLPAALQRRAGARTLEIRIGLATFACALAAALALASV